MYRRRRRRDARNARHSKNYIKMLANGVEHIMYRTRASYYIRYSVIVTCLEFISNAIYLTSQAFLQHIYYV